MGESACRRTGHMRCFIQILPLILCAKQRSQALLLHAFPCHREHGNVRQMQPTIDRLAAASALIKIHHIVCIRALISSSNPSRVMSDSPLTSYGLIGHKAGLPTQTHAFMREMDDTCGGTKAAGLYPNA